MPRLINSAGKRVLLASGARQVGAAGDPCCCGFVCTDTATATIAGVTLCTIATCTNYGSLLRWYSFDWSPVAAINGTFVVPKAAESDSQCSYALSLTGPVVSIYTTSGCALQSTQQNDMTLSFVYTKASDVFSALRFDVLLPLPIAPAHGRLFFASPGWAAGVALANETGTCNTGGTEANVATGGTATVTFP